MTRFSAAIVVAIVCFNGAPVMADEATVRSCALTKAFECTSDEGCRERTLQEMGLPRFIKIDFGAKAITSLDTTVLRAPTRFAAIERLEGITVLQGFEKRGWSMALGDGDGSLSLTASGDGDAFIVFGHCMAQ